MASLVSSLPWWTVVRPLASGSRSLRSTPSILATGFRVESTEDVSCAVSVVGRRSACGMCLARWRREVWWARFAREFKR